MMETLSFVCFVRLKMFLLAEHNLLACFHACLIAQVGLKIILMETCKNKLKQILQQISLVFYAPSNWPLAPMIDFKVVAILLLVTDLIDLLLLVALLHQVRQVRSRLVDEKRAIKQAREKRRDWAHNKARRPLQQVVC